MASSIIRVIIIILSCCASRRITPSIIRVHCCEMFWHFKLHIHLGVKFLWFFQCLGWSSLVDIFLSNYCFSSLPTDIKPENLLISKDGVLKLCDFGKVENLKHMSLISCELYHAMLLFSFSLWTGVQFIELKKRNRGEQSQSRAYWGEKRRLTCFSCQMFLFLLGVCWQALCSVISC